MCDIPSWITGATYTATGKKAKAVWNTDNDVKALIANGEMTWEEAVGHSAIRRVHGVTWGEDCEGRQGVPRGMLRDIAAGRLNRMIAADLNAAADNLFEILPQRFLRDITELDMPYRRGIKAAVVSERLSECPKLEMLDLSGTTIRDISGLAKCKRLSNLYLTDTNVRDISSLAHCMKLDDLNLGDTGVKDISALAHCRNLRWLSIVGTSVSDVRPLAKLRKLRCVRLYGSRVKDFSALDNMPDCQVYT